jgi:AbrB family transcriptional regulator (stage V sporulation protein T)
MMKATGIVRRIDDLGRVVIPKEIRRTMRIREGDPLEIYTSNDGEVIFKKYSPITEISAYSSMYAEVLYKNGGLPCIVCDKDHVVSAAGIPKKEILERRISPLLEELMEQRKSYAYTDTSKSPLRPVEGIDRYAVASAVITVAGDVVGTILFLSGDSESKATDLQIKLIDVAASLIAKQLED